MEWLELTVDVPCEFVEPISRLFGRHGHGVVVQELPDFNAQVTTYVPAADREGYIYIDVGISLMRHIKSFPIMDIKKLDDDDWETAWKSHFTLLRVTSNLVIKPSWIDYTPSIKELVIEIDPGMSFGTGHHPSTRACLELLNKLVHPGMRIMDIGCGSGILTIAAVKLGAEKVFALDVDAIAVQVSKDNLVLNGGIGSVELLEGSLPHEAIHRESVDLVVANISEPSIRDLSTDVYRSLKKSGCLIASGMLKSDCDKLETYMNNVGFSTICVREIDDWATLVLTKEV